jgi:hypothetical protein
MKGTDGHAERTKAVSLTHRLIIGRLLRNPKLYDWAVFYFRSSPAERIHQLLKDTLSFKLGWKPDDISHVFVILATKVTVEYEGIKVTSGACVQSAGPTGECGNPAHLAIACRNILRQLEEDIPDLAVRIEQAGRSADQARAAMSGTGSETG